MSFMQESNKLEEDGGLNARGRDNNTVLFIIQDVNYRFGLQPNEINSQNSRETYYNIVKRY